MTLIPEHADDFVLFSGEKVFTVASPVNLQNDRDCAPSSAKKRGQGRCHGFESGGQILRPKRAEIFLTPHFLTSWGTKYCLDS